MRDKMAFFLLCAISALCFCLYVVARIDARRAEHARQNAVQQVAEAQGFAQAASRDLSASSLENAALRGRVARLVAAGGKITERVKIVSGTGTVLIPCPPASSPGESAGLAPLSKTPPASGTSSGPVPVPGVPVTVGPASVECGVVDARWWACSGVDVKVTPPGETVHLPLDTAKSRFELAPVKLDLGGRLALAPRAPRYWRAGWSAGPALVVSADGTPSVGVGVMWGVQF